MLRTRNPAVALTSFLAVASLAFVGVAGCGAGPAKSDISLGAVTHRSDGKISVPVIVSNPTDQQRNYSIQVEYQTEGGTTEDVSTVLVNNVPAKGKSEATAVSNRSLPSTTKAKVLSASRY